MSVKESQTDSGFLVVRAVQLSFNVLIHFLDVVTGSCPPQLTLQTNRLHSSPNLPYLKCSCLYAILLWVWPSNTNMWELVAVNCCMPSTMLGSCSGAFLSDIWLMMYVSCRVLNAATLSIDFNQSVVDACKYVYIYDAQDSGMKV